MIAGSAALAYGIVRLFESFGGDGSGNVQVGVTIVLLVITGPLVKYYLDNAIDRSRKANRIDQKSPSEPIE